MLTNIYKIFSASFALLLLHIPERSLLKRFSLADALGVYILGLAFSLLIELFPYPPLSEGELDLSFWSALVSVTAGTLFIVVFSWFLINKFAKTKFTLLEVFILHLLISSGVNILLSILGITGYVVGSWFLVPFIIANIALIWYMIYVAVEAISHMASISKSRALLVIVLPIFALFVVAVLYYATAESFTPTSLNP